MISLFIENVKRLDKYAMGLGYRYFSDLLKDKYIDKKIPKNEYYEYLNIRSKMNEIKFSRFTPVISSKDLDSVNHYIELYTKN